MEKTNLLNELLNKINYFENISLEDFCLLNSLETYELGEFNDKVSQVTPLLNQICSYVLTGKIINDIALEYISDVVDEKKYETCMSICKKCDEYIEILINEGCKHPSVTNVINCVNGSYFYEQFYDYLSSFIIDAENPTKQILTELMYDADEIIQRMYDNLLENLHTVLKNNKNLTTEQ